MRHEFDCRCCYKPLSVQTDTDCTDPDHVIAELMEKVRRQAEEIAELRRGFLIICGYVANGSR